MKELKVLLKDKLDQCEEYLHDLAMRKDSDYNEAYKTKFEDLPTLMLHNDWAKRRFKGENISEHSICIEVLSNCEMDFDEYKHLGENDGSLYTLYAIYKKLGMNDEAHKAMSLVYSEE